MNNTVVLGGELTLENVFDGELTLAEALDGECGVITKVKEADYYTGETEITPAAEAQTLHTLGLLVPSDIIIKPIPSNYGLITWDGSTLIVS